MVSTRTATICCAFLFLAGVAIAEKKTFNVVSFAKEVQVSVNGGKAISMERSHPGQPVYTVDMDLDGSIQYRYVEDGKMEDFIRKFPSDASATFYDFYGRKHTIKHLPQLPLPFEEKENGQWTRGMGQVNPFNETYIPTVHFTGKKIVKFFKKPPKGPKKKDEVAEDVTPIIEAKQKFTAFFVLQDETRLFEGVELEATNKRMPKFAIKMKLGDNDEFYGRKVIKFRFGENDPTFLREKLYTDLLVAVGAPVHQTGLVRVYADNVPIGLYILQDETGDDMFIRTEFYGKGNAPSKMGYPLDAGTGSDFLWTDQSRHPKDPWDAFTPNNYYRSDASNDRVVELSRALHKLDPTDEDAVKVFDRDWFDIDTFFKAMAFEYALGHWDSYWGLTTNFVVYDDPKESKTSPETFKFYFLDQDFEFSFGSCLNEEFNEFGDQFPVQSYKTLLDRTWGKTPLDAKRRTMIDKLISGNRDHALTKRFESILVTIVKHLLNPVSLFDRIDALAERYRDELEWDRSLERLRTGKMNRHWTLEDLDYGINGYPPGNPKAEAAGIAWGLKPYVQLRADAVAKEFKFDYNEVARPAKSVDSQPEELDRWELWKTETSSNDPLPSHVEKTTETSSNDPLPSHVEKTTETSSNDPLPSHVEKTTETSSNDPLPSHVEKTTETSSNDPLPSHVEKTTETSSNDPLPSHVEKTKTSILTTLLIVASGMAFVIR